MILLAINNAINSTVDSFALIVSFPHAHAWDSLLREFTRVEATDSVIYFSAHSSEWTGKKWERMRENQLKFMQYVGVLIFLLYPNEDLIPESRQ